MIDYILQALKRWKDFQGRSRRSEFWYFYLGIILSFLVFGFFISLLDELTDSLSLIPGFPFGVVFVAILVPFLACAVRRLHDSGKSGWFLLLYFVPLGALVLLIFFCQDSHPAPNQMGSQSKSGYASRRHYQSLSRLG